MQTGKLIAVRADVGGVIGTGHWVRTHALADELAARGHQVLFIARNQSNSMVNPLSPHEVLWLPKYEHGSVEIARPEGPKDRMHEDFFQLGELSDFQDVLSVLGGGTRKIDLLVADHYGITSTWQKLARKISNFIVTIDDLADRSLDTDLLIDPNFYINHAVRYSSRLSRDCKMLLGPAYALLKPSFRSKESPRQPSLDQLGETAIVCFGGAEFGVLNFEIAQLLLSHTDLKVTVLGSVAPENSGKWQNLARQFQGRLDGPRFSSDPAVDMRSGAVFIGSGGTITWERFAVGLPGAILAIARNQEQVSIDVAKEGCQIYLGPATNFDPDAALNAIQRLRLPEVRLPMIDKMKMLVDGYGTVRVADALERLMDR